MSIEIIKVKSHENNVMGQSLLQSKVDSQWVNEAHFFRDFETLHEKIKFFTKRSKTTKEGIYMYKF